MGWGLLSLRGINLTSYSHSWRHIKYYEAVDDSNMTVGPFLRDSPNLQMTVTHKPKSATSVICAQKGLHSHYGNVKNGSQREEHLSWFLVMKHSTNKGKDIPGWIPCSPLKKIKIEKTECITRSEVLVTEMYRDRKNRATKVKLSLLSGWHHQPREVGRGLMAARFNGVRKWKEENKNQLWKVHLLLIRKVRKENRWFCSEQWTSDST